MKTNRKYIYDAASNEMVKRYTIKEIFQDNWDDFVIEMESQGKPIRPTIMEEVAKIIGCQDPINGFALYICPKCAVHMRVPFTCKSRFCNTCGAKYSKDRALAMSKTLLKAPHRHVVFTIPEELRPYFAKDRSLLNILFEAAAETIEYRLYITNKSEQYIPGMISTLHTFGRDLKWNPHIHMILCEKAIGKSNLWKHFNHINYEGLRKSWMFTLIKRLSAKISDPSFKSLVDNLYKTNDNGFYVYAPPIKDFNAGTINYIVRYTGRPVLAQSRITDYTGEHVTFTYTPHDSNEIITETLHVFDFIKKLIIHIPERNFKMIRYQGFYFKRKREQYLRHQKRLEFTEYSRMLATHGSWRKRIIYYFKRDPLKCIYCRATLELAELFCNPRKIKYYFTIYNRWTDPYLERLGS